MVWLESIATISGILCVWLTAKRNVLCWPIGLIQILIYIYIFYVTQLYADVVLHIVFLIMSIIGWLNWDRESDEMLIRTDTTHWIPIGFLIAIVWGYVICVLTGQPTSSTVPYLDAVIATYSLVATWLLVKKNVTSWMFWIVADVLAIGVYMYKELYVTSFLYLVFLGLAIYGYISWTKKYQILKYEN